MAWMDGERSGNIPGFRAQEAAATENEPTGRETTENKQLLWRG